MSMLPSLLTLIADLVQRTGGYFVLPTEEGGEIVIATRKVFDTRTPSTSESQATLPLAPSSESTVAEAHDVLEKINRDIALFQLQQLEEDEEPSVSTVDGSEEEPTVDDLSLAAAEGRPPRRVRFEPLRGDLPPELQD